MSDYSLFADSTLPYELNERVQGELSPGEMLLWVGQPRPGLMARSALPMMLFGIPFTAFAAFWIATASGMIFLGGAPPGGGIPRLFAFFPLFGIPFLLVGLGLLTSPYWMRRRARKTCYALTDQRAVLFLAGWFDSVQVRSYRADALSRIHRTQHSDGSGDLVFEEQVSYGTDSEGRRTTSTTRYGFMAIDRVREIEELLTKALLTKPAGGSS